MVRVISVILVSLAISPQATAQLKLGEPLSGETSTQQVLATSFVKKRVIQFDAGSVADAQASMDMTRALFTEGFGSAIPVALKKGQSYTFAAEVTGDNRSIRLFLVDPTGILVAVSDKSKVSAKLKINETHTSGAYKIVVFSNLSGSFSLLGYTGDEEDKEALRARLKQLEQQAEEIKRKIAEYEKSDKKK